MKYIYIIFITLLVACASTDNKAPEVVPNKEKEVQKKIVRIHNNLLIVPDLSSNINLKKGYSDKELVQYMVSQFYNLTQTNNRKVHQKDRVRVCLANGDLGIKTEDLTLDVGHFEKNQKDRIQYLTNNPNMSHTLKDDSLKVMNNIDKLYEMAKNYPTSHQGKYLWFDIWNFLDKEISSKDADIIGHKFDTKLVKDSVRNILIIITDGYIEAGKKYAITHGTSSNRLSSEMLVQFRKDFHKANSTDIGLFFNQQPTRVLPVNNPILSNFEVLVLELYDRNLNEMGISTLHPTDIQIMEEYWKNFLEKSGVNSYKILSTSSSFEKTKQEINTFLGL